MSRVAITGILTVIVALWVPVTCVSVAVVKPGSYGMVLRQKSTDTREGSQDIEAQSGTAVKNSFRPLPFPVNFRFYDRNRDGYIGIQELKTITGDAENMEAAFRASDLNGDGWVSRREYDKVPWGYNRHTDLVLSDRR